LKTLRATLLILLASLSAVYAYGPAGHELVGAIADERLKKNPEAAAKISGLLDGMTLERASTIADEIKAWDKNGPDDVTKFPHYGDHKEIDQQLREFWHANPPTPDQNSAQPSHHWFHYTDVPIFKAEKYSDGKAGRKKWDVVHMIPYCVSVLKGEIPENNERKITKSIAVILLSHYVGDIHQPLHVGAEYFDQGGQAADPDKVDSPLADEGGNTITLHLADDPAPHRGGHYKKLHGFWDSDAVDVALGVDLASQKDEKTREERAAVAKFAQEMAASEPKNWRLPRDLDLKKYAEAWADEILPLAREAHERIQLSGVHSQVENERTVAAGEASEKQTSDHQSYRQWAANIVRDEIHKAGWRLADLLEKSVSSSTSAAAKPTAPATETAIPPEPMPAKPATPSPTVAAAEPSSTAAPQSPYGEYPANYKEVITGWLRKNQRANGKIDWQTEPKPSDLPRANGQPLRGYLVIFNTTEQGRSKTRSVLIRDGAIVNNTGF
jgi:hypothetical protein